jgi:hypothetical protein
MCSRHHFRGVSKKRPGVPEESEADGAAETQALRSISNGCVGEEEGHGEGSADC